MKMKRLALPKIAALSAAFVMVAAGLVLSRVTGAPEAAAAQDEAPASVSAAPTHAEENAAVSESLELGVADAEADSDDSIPGPGGAPRAAEAKPLPTGGSVPPASARPKQTTAPARTRSLPPLPPPNWGAATVSQLPSGPPPDVLWLSGVVQGEPRVAVLRRGENRYVVSEGDVFEENYRVLTISSNTISLQRGSRKRTLRVGQY